MVKEKETLVKVVAQKSKEKHISKKETELGFNCCRKFK